ncbi:MAG: hypothetical protein ACI9R8_001544 [Candidatus Paceibacteria bacterium]|jgi:hypothetical protein
MALLKEEVNLLAMTIEKLEAEREMKLRAIRLAWLIAEQLAHYC